MKSKHLIIIVLGIALFYSCSPQSQSVNLPPIQQPLPGIAPVQQRFMFDASVGDSIQLANGGYIIIPAMAFVDSLNKPVSGKLELKYTEMHNALDIFLSGAPMQYDSLGQNYYMQTAGMLELRVYQQDNELNLGKDKRIKIRTASFANDDSYNFYSLNDSTGQWSYKGNTSPINNPQQAALQLQMNELKNKPAFPFTSDYFALNPGMIADIFYDLGRKLPKNGVQQKAKEYGIKVYNYQSYCTLQYGGKYYYPLELLWYREGGLELPAWANEDTYVFKAESLGNRKFRLYFKEQNKTERTTSIVAQAYLPLNSVFKRSANKWRADYNEIIKQVDALEARMETEAAVFRDFEIDQTGFHNWDVVKPYMNPVLVDAQFDWGQKQSEGEFADTPYVYYFINKAKCLVRLSPNNWKESRFIADSSAFFVVVSAPNELAIFDTKAYQSIDFSRFNAQTAKQLKLPMVKKAVANRADIEKLFKPNPQSPGR